MPAGDLPIFEAARSDWFAIEREALYRPPLHASHAHADAMADGDADGATLPSTVATPLPDLALLERVLYGLRAM